MQLLHVKVDTVEEMSEHFQTEISEMKKNSNEMGSQIETN